MRLTRSDHTKDHPPQLTNDHSWRGDSAHHLPHPGMHDTRLVMATSCRSQTLIPIQSRISFNPTGPKAEDTAGMRLASVGQELVESG